MVESFLQALKYKRNLISNKTKTNPGGLEPYIIHVKNTSILRIDWSVAVSTLQFTPSIPVPLLLLWDTTVIYERGRNSSKLFYAIRKPLLPPGVEDVFGGCKQLEPGHT